MARWHQAGSALLTAVLAASAAALHAAESKGGGRADRLLEGELVRVDLAKKTLTVRAEDAPAHEVDVSVDAATLITASGRPMTLDELKPLERIVVLCDGALTGSCRARRVRAGPARRAVGPAAPP
jgi:hypothetical protein